MFYSYVLSEAFISIIYRFSGNSMEVKVCHEYFWSVEDAVYGRNYGKLVTIFKFSGSKEKVLEKAGVQQNGYRENRARTDGFRSINLIRTKGVSAWLSKRGALRDYKTGLPLWLCPAVCCIVPCIILHKCDRITLFLPMRSMRNVKRREWSRFFACGWEHI